MKEQKPDHPQEPWMQDGRYVLDASGSTLASTRFPADARRIVAAINAVRGIPTDSLESWFVNVLGQPPAEAPAASAERPESAEAENLSNDRRLGERRQGERRAGRPYIHIFHRRSAGQDPSEGGSR